MAKPTVPQLLVKLEEMYHLQDDIIKEGKKLLKKPATKEVVLELDKLKKQYEQLTEDIELCSSMIMHQSNKGAR